MPLLVASGGETLYLAGQAHSYVPHLITIDATTRPHVVLYLRRPAIMSDLPKEGSMGMRQRLRSCAQSED